MSTQLTPGALRVASLRCFALTAPLALAACSGPVSSGISRQTTAPATTASVTAPATPAAPLALTPPMGFNNWNAFGCDVSESLIKDTANVLVSSGLKDAGYVQVNIDDCWSLRERGKDGRLVADPVKFPSGIKALADYVHGLGLKLGIYGDAGTKTCAGYPGSLGQEQLDAATWASWGIDYVKYDNCYNQSDGSRADYVRRYTAMREAIDRTGRPMVYSICEWGESQPWEWAKGVGQLWRTTGDINDDWPSVRSIIAANAKLAEHAGPGHWNDPDMLEIGNGGMTETEYRTHMSLWAMMAAPLIIGTDLRKVSREALAILLNREIIALDQDPLGKQAKVVSEDGGLLVFSKPLAGGDTAVALYNSTDALARVSVSAERAGLAPAAAYRLKDLWSGEELHAGATLAAGVPAHGTVVYRVRRLDAEMLPPAISVSAELPALTPNLPGGATLTATIANHGVVAASAVSATLQPPSGWNVHPLDAVAEAPLAPGALLTRRFRLTAPPNTPAALYPVGVQANYTWGAAQRARSSAELTATAVVPPPDGVSHLSRLTPVRATSGLGPVERDMASGRPGEGDGSLITIEGQVFTHGLGARARSEVVYYLGKRCSSFTSKVGIDDEPAKTGGGSFQVFADDKLVADSGFIGPNDAARALSANLKGVAWLRLVTNLADANYGAVAATDWASPLVTCGAGTKPAHFERVLYSFDALPAGFTARGTGGSFAISSTFHTDGERGLDVKTAPDGNWFGASFSEPLDLSAATHLAFDVKTTSVGTPGELAVELGPEKVWCQGGRWAWTNPGSTRTIKTSFKDMGCPGGAPVDPARITGVWFFLKGGAFSVDQVRAEL